MEFKAHYKDENHDCDIIIKSQKVQNNSGTYTQCQDNTYWELSFTLDGITFVGIEFDDFELKNPNDYETAKNKFNILKWGNNTFSNGQYYYNLQRYSITVEIPIDVIKRDKVSLCKGIIKMQLALKAHNPNIPQVKTYCDSEQVFRDNSECTEFALIVDNMYFSADKLTTDFESALLQIHRKCKDDYLMKCCFTCQYSDYSPYGNGDFGTMLCYKRHKDIYLTVNNKDDFFEKLFELDFEQQQETNVCDCYEERLKCEGYRGKV